MHGFVDHVIVNTINVSPCVCQCNLWYWM